MRKLIITLIALALPALTLAQQAANPTTKTAQKRTTEPTVSARPQGLTVDSIASMVQAGLSEDLVVARIRKEGKAFDLSPEEMIKLKKAGVSDAILHVMLDPKAEIKPAGAPPPAAEPPPPPVGAPLGTAAKQAPEPASPTAGGAEPGALIGGVAPFTEVGVYYKKAGQWMEVLPEVVNWRTGGPLKSIASVGIVKKDVNGNIPGLHSRNSVNLPAEFMIYAPEGVMITEYQLIRLRAKNDYREFRTITGGVFNQRSGAMRDMVPFEGKKVGNRLYSVILPANLGAGEYGFILPLGSVGVTGSASAVGKMYTFRVLE